MLTKGVQNAEEILKKELVENNFGICDKDYELAIAIGGDGSFLRMLKQNNFNDLQQISDYFG